MASKNKKVVVMSVIGFLCLFLLSVFVSADVCTSYGGVGYFCPSGESCTSDKYYCSALNPNNRARSERYIDGSLCRTRTETLSCGSGKVCQSGSCVVQDACASYGGVGYFCPSGESCTSDKYYCSSINPNNKLRSERYIEGSLCRTRTESLSCGSGKTCQSSECKSYDACSNDGGSGYFCPSGDSCNEDDYYCSNLAGSNSYVRAERYVEDGKCRIRTESYQCSSDKVCQSGDCIKFDACAEFGGEGRYVCPNGETCTDDGWACSAFVSSERIRYKLELKEGRCVSVSEMDSCERYLFEDGVCKEGECVYGEDIPNHIEYCKGDITFGNFKILPDFGSRPLNTGEKIGNFFKSLFGKETDTTTPCMSTFETISFILGILSFLVVWPLVNKIAKENKVLVSRKNKWTNAVRVISALLVALIVYVLFLNLFWWAVGITLLVVIIKMVLSKYTGGLL